jgi:hypothetical protein
VINQPVPEFASDYRERVGQSTMSLPDFMAKVRAGESYTQGYAIPCEGPFASIARSDDVNITVARCFRSPLHTSADLRLGNSRRALSAVLLRQYWKHLPLTVAGVLYALTRNIALGFDPRSVTP